jgi:hypothetical protein
MTDAGDGGLEGRSSVACCSVPRFDRSDRLVCLERLLPRAGAAFAESLGTLIVRSGPDLCALVGETSFAGHLCVSGRCWVRLQGCC